MTNYSKQIVTYRGILLFRTPMFRSCLIVGRLSGLYVFGHLTIVRRQISDGLKLEELADNFRGVKMEESLLIRLEIIR